MVALHAETIQNPHVSQRTKNARHREPGPLNLISYATQSVDVQKNRS
jgi:hypothetical protein